MRGGGGGGAGAAAAGGAGAGDGPDLDSLLKTLVYIPNPHEDVMSPKISPLHSFDPVLQSKSDPIAITDGKKSKY